MPERGTSEGRYLFEFDGVVAVRSSEVSGVKKNHEEFELYESNKGNPHLGRGHFNCEALKVKHAHALNQTGVEFFTWMDDFVKGISIERRGGRLIILDEDGDTPTAIYEFQNCIPKSFEPETHTAGGKNASFFDFMIRPEDFVLA
jgi:phage tail-like protein